MTSFRSSLVGLLILSAIGVGLGGVQSPAYGTTEYRAIWVDSWNPGFLDSPTSHLLVSRCQQHHFNTLFIEVSKVFDAYYKSSLLPRGTNIDDPNFDPLDNILRLAKSRQNGFRPLEVHAWVVALRAWKGKEMPPRNLQPTHVLHAHPEWVSVNYKGERNDGEGFYLDPGVPEVQDFLVAICKEIVQKYPVDGLHLDYIRYPGNQWGYNPIALARFQKELGRTDKPTPTDEQWSAWRRQQVNDLVRRVAAETKAIRPKLKMSAATITWGDVPNGDFTKTRAYNDALQNWVGWMEAGYLDINVPMIYKRSSAPLQARDYLDWLKLANDTKNGRHMIAGLGAWFNPLKFTNQQIEAARQIKSDGVCFFSYNQMESNPRSAALVMRDLHGNLFRTAAVIPSSSWLDHPRTGVVAGTDPKLRSGYPVLLLNSKGSEVARLRTDSNGHFYFFGVPTGTWQVKVGTASIFSNKFTVSPGKVIRAKF